MAETEYGWLIERNHLYLRDVAEHPAWTSCNTCALRFARKQDAETVCATLPIEGAVVAEHGWG